MMENLIEIRGKYGFFHHILFDCFPKIFPTMRAAMGGAGGVGVPVMVALVTTRDVTLGDNIKVTLI